MTVDLMSTLVVQDRHLWLNLVEMCDAEKARFLVACTYLKGMHLKVDCSWSLLLEPLWRMALISKNLRTFYFCRGIFAVEHFVQQFCTVLQ